MKKIIFITSGIVLITLLGGLSLAYWKIKKESEISTNIAKSAGSQNSEIEILNTPAAPENNPTASSTSDHENSPFITVILNGVTNLEAKIGEKLNLSWSSRNADNFLAKMEPSGCKYDFSPKATSVPANGEESQIITREFLDCTIKFIFEAVNSTTGQKATATATLIVVKDSGIPLPTASFTANNTDKLNVMVGEKYTLSWSSTNADTFYYTGSFTGCVDSAQNTNERKVESTAKGTQIIFESAARAGCTMIVTYVAENSTTGEKATAPVTINVSKGSASETTAYINNLIKSIIIMDSYGRAEVYYDDNNNSYSGVCTKEKGSSLFLKNKDRLLELSPSVACLDSSTAWAISAQLVGDATKHQCMDSTNNPVVRGSAITTTSCK